MVFCGVTNGFIAVRLRGMRWGVLWCSGSGGGMKEVDWKGVSIASTN